MAVWLQESRGWVASLVQQEGMSGKAMLASRCSEPSELEGMQSLLEHDVTQRHSAE